MRRIAGGIGPALPAHQSGAPVSSPTFDCTACGACCLGGSDRYVALLPEDRDRAIPEAATAQIDGRRYMRMACGHCAQLTMTGQGQTLCAIYDARPEACRAFRAGSFECLKARQHRGPQAEALRALALTLPDVPVAPPVMVPVAALVAPPPDEAVSPSP
ncbi:putative zinc- or iron-chelating protein [Roseicyclus mahoneyensis]|uniref:Putative zinc-or iron-chelating protein n=1 Tax=Roseicyclus mahoneyensis TaxID=164332 RepID=A0A316GMZ8_9RHOB|nr:putative zinc- or iron-chelating protein [Roseicyclus mahoneyensis]